MNYREDKAATEMPQMWKNGCDYVFTSYTCISMSPSSHTLFSFNPQVLTLLNRPG